MPKAQQDGRHSNADTGEGVTDAQTVTVAGDDPDSFLGCGCAPADHAYDPDDETGEDGGEGDDGVGEDDSADDAESVGGDQSGDPEPVRGPGGRFAPKS